MSTPVLCWKNTLKGLLEIQQDKESSVLALCSDIEAGAVPYDFYSLPHNAIALFIGTGLGVLPFQLANWSQTHTIYCVETCPHQLKKFAALAQTLHLNHMTFFASLDEAKTALRQTAQPINLLVLEAETIDFTSLSHFLEEHRVKSLIGHFNERMANAATLYRLCQRLTENFHWTHDHTGQIMAGRHDESREVSLVVAADSDDIAAINEGLTSLIEQTIQSKEIIVLYNQTRPTLASALQIWGTKFPHIIQIVPMADYTRGRAFAHGQKVASGRSVAFIDGTDWCDPTMFETLFMGLYLNQAEIARCDYRFVRYSDGGAENRHNYGIPARDSRQSSGILSTPLDLIDTDPMISRCLYSRSFLESNELSFLSYNIGYDDIYFQFLCASYARRITIIPDVFFNRRELPPTPEQQKSETMFKDIASLSDLLRKRIEANPSYFVEKTMKKLQIQLHSEAFVRQSTRRQRRAYGIKMMADIFKGLYSLSHIDVMIQFMRQKKAT